MTDTAIQDDDRARFGALAEALDVFFNGPKTADRDARTGFCLLVFPFGGTEGGNVNYISNAERESMRVALKELLDRWDGTVFIPENPQ